MKLFSLRPQHALRGMCSLLALAVYGLTACGVRQTAPNSKATPSPSLSQPVPTASAAASSPTPVNVEDQIERIRQQYAAIKQKLPNHRMIERDLAGFSAEGGSLKAYLDGQTTALIAVKLFGETGQADEEFYYDAAGNLFFVFRREHRYDKPFGKISRTTEQRFYFHAGKMIRWLLPDNHPASSDQAEFAEQEKRILTFSQTLLEKARP